MKTLNLNSWVEFASAVHQLSKMDKLPQKLVMTRSETAESPLVEIKNGRVYFDNSKLRVVDYDPRNERQRTVCQLTNDC